MVSRQKIRRVGVIVKKPNISMYAKLLSESLGCLEDSSGI
jgi:hypothetical protein